MSDSSPFVQTIGRDLDNGYEARCRNPELADWIDTHVAFPSTMVDRIVPSTTDAEREAALRALHTHDAVPVPCEPFRQGVIEDRFPAGRLAWEQAGAQLVDDVMPFELARLRMLNGTHSTFAYLSMLAGFTTIDEAIAHPPLRALIHAMMTHEIAPTLDVPPSFDVLAYRDADPAAAARNDRGTLERGAIDRTAHARRRSMARVSARPRRRRHALRHQRPDGCTPDGECPRRSAATRRHDAGDPGSAPARTGEPGRFPTGTGGRCQAPATRSATDARRTA